MKKSIIIISIILFAAGITFAATSSFKKHFIKTGSWQINVLEKTNLFKTAGLASCQGFYTKGIKKIVVSILLGRGVQKKPGNPVGFGFSMNGVTLKMIRKFGFITRLSYNNMRKAGTISVFFPKSRRQKHYGMLTFAFSNMGFAEAKRFAYRFNWRKIQRTMQNFR